MHAAFADRMVARAELLRELSKRKAPRANTLERLQAMHRRRRRAADAARRRGHRRARHRPDRVACRRRRRWSPPRSPSRPRSPRRPGRARRTSRPRRRVWRSSRPSRLVSVAAVAAAMTMSMSGGASAPPTPAWSPRAARARRAPRRDARRPTPRSRRTPPRSRSRRRTLPRSRSRRGDARRRRGPRPPPSSPRPPRRRAPDRRSPPSRSTPGRCTRRASASSWPATPHAAIARFREALEPRVVVCSGVPRPRHGLRTPRRPGPGAQGVHHVPQARAQRPGCADQIKTRLDQLR